MTSIKAHHPDTKEVDEEIVWKAIRKHLRDDEYIGHVEQFDRVGTSLASEATALEWNLDTEALQVNNGGK